MSKVALVRCNSYEYAEVKKAVQRGIDLLGGIGSFVNPGERILLKPNWVLAVQPEKNATTHPVVFKAVAEVFQKQVQLSYGDSPGYHSPETASQTTGFTVVADELGIALADFQNGEDVFFQEAVLNKRFTLARGVRECDGLISLPKLKTHAFLKLTGAVKNQLGCIPGIKADYHLKLQDPEDFARMLVDLNLYIKPRLYIMDGIVAMEGNGPMGGDPRKLNVLLFSADPVALDATVCRIINVNPEFSHTVTMGKAAGLGVYDEAELELVGDPVISFIDPDFAVDREPIASLILGGGIFRFFNNLFVPRPYIVGKKCIKCGACVKICPVKPGAVNWHDGNKKQPPSYKYKQCIRCYCCQEICQEGAIKLKVPVIRKILGKFFKNLKTYGR